MAADRIGALVNGHRIAQGRLGARVAAKVMSSWRRRIRPLAPAASAGPWLTEALADVAVHRAESEQLAGSYLRLQRALATGHTLPPLTGGPPERTVPLGALWSDYAELSGTPHRPEPDDDEPVDVDEDFEWPDLDEESMDAAARTSLWVTGPVHAERRLAEAEDDRARGRLDDAGFLAELDQMMAAASSTAAGAADREVLRGGRELVKQATARDKRVIGWARVTDLDPCAFCAMLASRGAVYKSRDIAVLAGGDVSNLDDLTKYHDMCHCQIVPVYSRDGWMPEQSGGWRDLWSESTKGLSGQAARRSFDRAVAARSRSLRRRSSGR
ncbi:hypothetical protein F4556_005191 [Kitasatospora gansuensis]|uniref:Uncharacterized protein n=1 Tax=Kitasatospora gansuensis TaxID=258050 RepID=A0A7W7SFR6_9ACTN|nr:hypothetical protein [Kitasatospora gansuensis]MBB4949656.1 hypothetical protein [Kitasatospora gansuensis]